MNYPAIYLVTLGDARYVVLAHDEAEAEEEARGTHAGDRWEGLDLAVEVSVQRLFDVAEVPMASAIEKAA